MSKDLENGLKDEREEADGGAEPWYGRQPEARRREMMFLGLLLRHEDLIDLAITSGITSDHLVSEELTGDRLTSILYDFIVGYHQMHGRPLTQAAFQEELIRRGLEANDRLLVRLLSMYNKCKMSEGTHSDIHWLISALRQHPHISRLYQVRAALMSVVDGAEPEAACRQVLEILQVPLPSTVGGLRMSSGSEILSVMGAQRWLWDRWIPMGHLTLMFGQAELGKSWLAQEIALATIGSVGEMPDGSAPPGVGRVLWLPYEGATILPQRLRDRGLPHDDILIANDITDRSTPLPMLQQVGARREPLICQVLERAVGADPLIRLIVVDSLSSGMGGVDENSKAVSEPLQRLSSLAERTGIAILLLHHPRKNSNDGERRHVVNLNSVRGHSSIVGIPRSIIALDMPVEDGRRMRVIKNSLAPTQPEPLGYELRDNRVVICDPPDEPWIERPRLGDCEAWLEDILRDGPRRRTEIDELAAEAGFSSRMVTRASEKLGVIKERMGELGAGGWWQWRLSGERCAGGDVGWSS